MKKDYRPVTEAQSKIDESTFVEDFWSQIWSERGLSDAAREQIEEHEEFKFMEPYIAKLPPDSRVLDGGCGLGEWTLYYASKGFDVVGLDISKATIDGLRQKFPNHRFIAGDIRKTQFDDDYFDAYFSWGTFEHFESGLGDCFREARRILKQRGHLFISVPYHNDRHLWRDRRDLWHWDENFDKDRGYTSNMRFYQWRLTIPELKREFEISGFKVLEVKPIAKQFGLDRAIRHDLHLNPGSTLHRIVKTLLYPLVPQSWVAHMIIGVGQKR
ncbi:MAG: class I SAM-dependent methyltransferase [Dehalococcoidia bacterium]